MRWPCACMCAYCTLASPSLTCAATRTAHALSLREARACASAAVDVCVCAATPPLFPSRVLPCIVLQIFNNAMSADGPSVDAPLPMVADIVERHVDFISSTAAASSPALVGPALRPIQAIPGQAFPVVRTRYLYGRQRTVAGEATTHLSALQSSQASLPSASAAARVTGFSAHVQPRDAITASADPYAAGGEFSNFPGTRTGMHGGETELVLAAGGSAQQRLAAHQWSVLEFEQLKFGYYVRPVDVSYSKADDTGKEAAATTCPTSPASSPSSCVRGEAFFSLVFQCLRSTVRKHQQLALEVLLAHLRGLAMTTTASKSARRTEAVALRDRCLHGPDCAPFVFFLLEILVSAGHPAMIELAATCLLLLFRGMTRGEPAGSTGSTAAPASVEDALGGCSAVSHFVEAVAELGSPAGGASEEDTEEGLSNVRGVGVEGSGAEEPADDPDLPFSEVSELLRGPDARLGLEQLGFTSKVLEAIHPLLRNASPASMVARGEGGEMGREGVESEAHRVCVEPTATSSTPSFSSSLASIHVEVLFLELLLCGGVGVGLRAACRRVTEDPAFLTWAEAQLSAVVMGRRRLEDIAELLCVLQHLSHVPSALHTLLCGSSVVNVNLTDTLDCGSVAAAAARQHAQHQFYETWLLFFTLVCSTSAAEVRTVRHASAILWSMLILRACARMGHNRSGTGNNGETGEEDAGHSKPAARHSGYGMVQDVSDTLLAEGMHVGGGVVMEMWFLRYASEDGTASAAGHATGSLEHYFLDAARMALHLCRSSAGTGSCVTPADVSSRDRHDAVLLEATVAQRVLAEMRWTASAHFLSTYIARMCHRSPAVRYTLCSTEGETEEAVQLLLRSVVMDAGRLTKAFARFTSPLLSTPWSGSADGLRKADADGAHPHTTGGDLAAVPVGAPTHHLKAVSAQVSVVSAIRAVERCWRREPSGNTASNDRAVEADSGGRDRALLFLCLDAASLYANTRLAAALAEVFPAIAADMVFGYAALLAHAFEEAFLRMRDGTAVRLQVDELCTMAEAVQLLQHLGNSGSSVEAAVPRSTLSTAGALPSNSPAARDTREARIAAFFLVHSVAVSKRCLDAVPVSLLLLLLRPQVEAKTKQERAAAAPLVPAATSTVELVALMDSLQSGIELTPVPVMPGSGGDATDTSASLSSAAAVSVSGAPRCWALYPLFDASFTAKDVWASWLRRLLGLHQRVKDVLGWDGMLSHVLLWTLAHRRELWSTAGGDTCEGAESGVRTSALSPSSAAALCELMVDLCAILHALSAFSCGLRCSADSSTAISAAASRTLEISLAAYSDAPSEEGMPLLLHALLAYVAAHCSARTALAALQVLLCSPVLPPSSTIAAGVEARGEPGDEQQSSGSPVPTRPGSRGTAATAQVCAWLQSWAAAQGWRMQSARSVCWSLDDVVALVQLVGPHFRNDNFSGRSCAYEGGATDQHGTVDAAAAEVMLTPTDADARLAARDGMWCARCLTEGLLQYYVQQRIATSGGLSMMEKMVLRSTLQDLDWYPSMLWPQVEGE
ncbi:conserved hypothetical protein [Leishmania mexicana MHOM/GT/2001/U1103]|uniref:RNA polymerase II-associated protein 1 C-terminal domain-containing protein n=1 Tax=Leishmania mexicana (strain MHOM/GT/2001/U1103) TaxID=929439 RepID=E9B1U9_LEIMU|nr:conserved hypothetical protein [Leishmania mexicana MHOM/GT/2001/U1103]CBZ29206.1 conserved hypothetical protein [Leishmania mexicana MHOM/GT/2001/U1103]